jgi:hypothetical protein
MPQSFAACRVVKLGKDILSLHLVSMHKSYNLRYSRGTTPRGPHSGHADLPRQLSLYQNWSLYPETAVKATSFGQRASSPFAYAHSALDAPV